MYHSVAEPDAADRLSLRVSRDQFRRQMEWLRTAGYRVVTLASVLQGGVKNDARCVAITFDDGYRDQLWAAGLLRDFGFPATFFLVPRFLDGEASSAAYWEQWDHMGWEDAALLLEAGFEIGAHSTTHVDLTGCADSQLATEVAAAKALLEARLHRSVESFSYPFGRHNHRVRSAVERAGYGRACTSRYGSADRSDDRFAVPRVEIAGTDDLTEVGWKLRGKYDWLRHWQDLTAAR